MVRRTYMDGSNSRHGIRIRVPRGLDNHEWRITNFKIRGREITRKITLSQKFI
jgi:hypothetical protein